MPDWAQSLVAQLWSFVAVAIGVYQLGQAFKVLADRMGWRRVRRRDVIKVLADPASAAPVPLLASNFDVALRVYPIVCGALFGFVPLPTLHVIDRLEEPSELVAARCAWFMLAGALSGQVYESVKFGIEQAKLRVAAKTPRGSAIKPTECESLPPGGSDPPEAGDDDVGGGTGKP